MDYKKNKSLFAVLGCVAFQPMSGYDIKKYIECSLGNFWKISFGQIYPILNRLEENQLVTSKLESQEGKPDRKVFTITEAGLAALREYLAKPIEVNNMKNELLLKLFFGSFSETSIMRKHLEDAKVAVSSKMKELEKISEQFSGDTCEHPNSPYWFMTVDLGVKVSHEYLNWIDDCLESLENIEARQKK